MSRIIAVVLMTVGLMASPAWAVVNGENANPSSHPSFVQILAKKDWQGGSGWVVHCGATHIGNGVLATAAHCLRSADFNYNQLMFVSAPLNEEFEYQFCVEGERDAGCVTHPDYDSGPAGYTASGFVIYLGGDGVVKDIEPEIAILDSRYNYFGLNDEYDFGLIRVPELSSVPSIGLFPDSSESEGLSVHLIGRGSEYREPGIQWDDSRDNINFKETAFLQALDTLVAQASECESQYGANKFKDGRMVCVGTPSNDDSLAKGSCTGDSGGPLIETSNGVLLGVSSFTNSPCASYYSVYTDVSFYEGSGWIEYYLDYLASEVEYPRALDFDSIFPDTTADLVLDWDFTNNTGSAISISNVELMNFSIFSIVSDTCSSQAISPGGVCTIKVRQDQVQSITESLELTIGGIEESIVLDSYTGESTADRTLEVQAELNSSGEISETITFTKSSSGSQRMGSLVATSDLNYSNGCEGVRLDGTDTCTISVTGYLGGPGTYTDSMKVNIDGKWEYYRVRFIASVASDDSTTDPVESDNSGSGSGSSGSSGGAFGSSVLLFLLSIMAIARMRQWYQPGATL